VTTCESPGSIVPDSGVSLSHGASVNGSIVPWPASGAQSEGAFRPTTIAVLMNPSSPPRASSGTSKAIVWSSTEAGSSATMSNDSASTRNTMPSLFARNRSTKNSMPTSWVGLPKKPSAGTPVDGSWSVSRYMYPPTWAIGVVGAKSIAIDAIVEPSEPARTVVTSFESSESPAGSVMIVLSVGVAPGPGVVSWMIVFGKPAGGRCGPQVAFRIAVGAGGSSGAVAPWSRSLASHVRGPVPELDNVTLTSFVWPKSTVALTSVGSTLATDALSTKLRVASPSSTTVTWLEAVT
jgi:hypothetical protein